jgi:hypothetical protein
MQFTKQLRPRIRSGQITCTIRIWQSPRVKVGGRYKMEEGAVEVDSMQRIDLDDITPALARQSGFEDVKELLAVAKHGAGHDVYLIHFHYIPAQRAGRRSPAPNRKPAS